MGLSIRISWAPKSLPMDDKWLWLVDCRPILIRLYRYHYENSYKSMRNDKFQEKI
jgi:hypothetical protein